MPFLLAVTAADVAVVAAVAVTVVLVAVAVVRSLEVASSVRRLARTAADGVDRFEFVVVEKVGGDAGQRLWGVVDILHLAGRDTSGQRSEGIFHVDSLQLGSVGLGGCDSGLAGLHDLGPDWVSETGQELLVFEKAESVFDAFGFDLDLLGSIWGGGVDWSKPDSLSVVGVGTLQLVESGKQPEVVPVGNLVRSLGQIS